MEVYLNSISLPVVDRTAPNGQPTSRIAALVVHKSIGESKTLAIAGVRGNEDILQRLGQAVDERILEIIMPVPKPPEYDTLMLDKEEDTAMSATNNSSNAKGSTAWLFSRGP